MPSNTLTQFYRRLIEGRAPIRADLQPRILDHLLAVREFGLVGAFARRVDVTPETDGRIAARGEALIIAGWASRPGRSREELTSRLGKEKRATVLLPLAKMTELPADLYRQVSETSSVKVAEALLENPSVPRDVKLAKIAAASASIDKKGEWRQREFIASALGQDRELIEELLRHSNDAVVVTNCLDRLGEVSREMLDVVLARFDTLAATGNEYYSPVPALCETLAEKDLSASQLQKLRSAVKSLHERAKTKNYGSETYATSRFLLSENGRSLTAKCRRLAVSTDVAEASSLFAELVRLMRKNNVENRVLHAAVTNRVLPPKVLEPHMNDLHGDLETRLACNWMQRGEYARLAAMAVDMYWSPAWMDECPDMGAFLSAVVEHVRDKDEALPDWVLTHEYVLSTPQASVLFLPWKQLHRISADGFNLVRLGSPDTVEGLAEVNAKVDAVAEVAQQLIVDRLGDDKLLWETFNTLADEFEGPLPDLLDAVVAISA